MHYYLMTSLIEGMIVERLYRDAMATRRRVKPPHNPQGHATPQVVN